MSAETQNEMDRLRKERDEAFARGKQVFEDLRRAERDRDICRAEYLEERDARQTMQDEVNHIEQERDEYHSHLTVIAEMTGDTGDIGAAWASVNALQEALVASEKREQALAKTLERCRAAHANGKDMYYGVVEQCQESDIQASQAGMRLRKAEEQRDALAAHVDRMAQALKYHRVIHDMDEMPEELQRAHEEMETAILASPAASLARIKAEAAAEALEEEANEWPADKYTECSHVRESILGSAAQLRQQAEAGES